MPKKNKKRTITSYRNELKKLISQYVRNRDQWKCCHCLKSLESYDAHTSHVIPTSQSEYLRYNPLNMKTLCMRCHLYWWHKDPIDARNWFAKTFPIRYAFLIANRHIIQKTSIEYFELWITKYKKLLEVQNEHG
jgi:5-methylcytosine-specific restriction endonuclease McrA